MILSQLNFIRIQKVQKRVIFHQILHSNQILNKIDRNRKDLSGTLNDQLMPSFQLLKLLSQKELIFALFILLRKHLNQSGQIEIFASDFLKSFRNYFTLEFLLKSLQSLLHIKIPQIFLDIFIDDIQAV
jgi:hypothetical protein